MKSGEQENEIEDRSDRGRYTFVLCIEVIVMMAYDKASFFADTGWLARIEAVVGSEVEAFSLRIDASIADSTRMWALLTILAHHVVEAQDPWTCTPESLRRRAGASSHVRMRMVSMVVPEDHASTIFEPLEYGEVERSEKPLAAFKHVKRLVAARFLEEVGRLSL
ncbi:MAG: hypothetical protein ACRDY0_00385 [Acidimicrobiales bacterium]